MRPTAAALVAALAARGQTLATAESCTGGLLSAAVVDIPGASAVFAGGVVSYTDAVKTAALGVDGALLSAFGAVSAEVACAMARGARERLGTDYGISTTGLAGPGGGTAETPVGTVFLGLSSAKEERAVCLHLPGLDRDGVRQQTVERALEIMLAFLGEDVL